MDICVEKKISYRCRLLLASLVFLSGCALTEDKIEIQYTPDQKVKTIQGADKIQVSVHMTDNRKIKDKVSCKKNGYGAEMAAIRSKNDIVSLVKNSIEIELKNRGFKIEDGNKSVLVELDEFYNDFKTGFWSGNAVADVNMLVQVKDNRGAVLYTRTIRGTNDLSGTMLYGGNNAKESLEKALQNAVKELMNDQAFLNALLKES